MPPNFETLLIETLAPHVQLVMLNRSEVSNAFNTQMAKDLITLFEGFSLDTGDVRALVLTG